MPITNIETNQEIEIRINFFLPIRESNPQRNEAKEARREQIEHYSV